MKKVLAITLTLLSIKSFALTEDYILWSRAEIYAQKKQAKKKDQDKSDVCQKLSKNAATEKHVLIQKNQSKPLKIVLRIKNSAEPRVLLNFKEHHKVQCS